MHTKRCLTEGILGSFFQSFFAQNYTNPDSVASILNVTPLERHISQKIKLGDHPILQERCVKYMSHSY